MQRIDHPLLSQSLGSQKTLTSFHFGTADEHSAQPKVYIQASLHADEIPGMMAAYHLRALLEKADAAQRILGQVVLVPVANPIGLAQQLDHKPMGRFELATSENFNRHYPDLCAAVLPKVRGQLGKDAAQNVATVRRAVAEYLQAWQPKTELASLRKRLVSLSFDADVVLDLHCDFEAPLHIYTETPCWPKIEPLAKLLGAEAVLLARNSGGLSFDEGLSGHWWQLAEALATELPEAALPQATASATIELRGEVDVTHALGEKDAKALFAYLQHLGVVEGPAPTLPALPCAATPLSGSQTVESPVPGIVVFAAAVGQRLEIGDTVAEVIDPINNTVHLVRAEVAGVLYARIARRYVMAGEKLGNIAGSVPYRTGNLLSA